VFQVHGVDAEGVGVIRQKLDTPQAGPAGADDLMSFLDERGSHELMAAFKDPKPALRSRLIALAKAMAGADAED
jgi:hypothetical protein